MPLNFSVGKLTPSKRIDESALKADYQMWQGDTLAFLKKLPKEELFDLVVTSPPYNIGKSYEKKQAL